MKSLVLFDMDGVLINSEPVHMRLEREIFARLRLPISEVDHHSFVGMSPREMWAEIKARCDLPQQVEALVAMETGIKAREIGNMTLHAIDGVERLIRKLTDNGYNLAIASSSSKMLIDIVTAKLGFRQYFSQRISAEEVERGKPHPDIFLRAAELCGRAPTECVVVEDSHSGLRAAIAAGMKCVGYVNENSGNQDLSDAHLIVEDFSEGGIRQIMEFLRSLE